MSKPRFASVARLALVLLATAALTSCRDHPVSKTFSLFDEKGLPEKQLRVWVSDPLPPDTILLDYYTENAWDGTKFQRWVLQSSTGFATLVQPTPQRAVFWIPAESCYASIEPRLKEIGFKFVGSHVSDARYLSWKTPPKIATVGGYILPHSGGEILEIDRTSSK